MKNTITLALLCLAFLYTGCNLNESEDTVLESTVEINDSYKNIIAEMELKQDSMLTRLGERSFQKNLFPRKEGNLHLFKNGVVAEGETVKHTILLGLNPFFSSDMGIIVSPDGMK